MGSKGSDAVLYLSRPNPRSGMRRLTIVEHQSRFDLIVHQDSGRMLSESGQGTENTADAPDDTELTRRLTSVDVNYLERCEG